MNVRRAGIEKVGAIALSALLMNVGLAEAQRPAPLKAPKPVSSTPPQDQPQPAPPPAPNTESPAPDAAKLREMILKQLKDSKGEALPSAAAPFDLENNLPKEPPPPPPSGANFPETPLQRIYPGPDSIKPSPLEPIPDNPPPHEGALFDLPYRIGTTDLVVVEVLEALPGRPISGERLVRPDGTISLGFYGEIYVRGLTTRQVKEKIVLHLCRFLNDQVLGLVIIDPGTNQWTAVEPAESSRVFVDISSYNSPNYHVLGEVVTPGRIPQTGNDTVLDAIGYAGGLKKSADPKNIRLYRPARGDKPAREYRIDLEAIQRGEVKTNYQLFSGDRIIVGRTDMANAADELERLGSSFHSLLWYLSQASTSIQKLVQMTPNLTPRQREELVRDWFVLWKKTPTRSGDSLSNESSFQELILKQIQTAQEKNTPTEAEKR